MHSRQPKRAIIGFDAVDLELSQAEQGKIRDAAEHHQEGIMRKKMLAAVLLWSMVLAGCSVSGESGGWQAGAAETNEENQDDAGAGSDDMEPGNSGLENSDSVNTDPGSVGSENAKADDDSQAVSETVRPTKEEVLAMREQVLEGMSAEEIKRLTENIKVANQRMESAYLYDAVFEKLEDSENLYWNYFDEKGEIQVGWTFDGSYQEMRAIMEKENLSREEFDSRYGTPVMVYNRFNADNFMNLMGEMKDLVQNGKLKDDLQQIIDETGLAAETHEMEHAANIYRLLHDMDYYLLRYGLEDVGQYVQDTSTIAKYYGVLSVYD